jgi:hypothetical protein
MVQTPDPGYYPIILFVGLGAAGANGALVRSIISSSEEAIPIVSFILGCVAGFFVGFAYLIPQWIGAPGVLEPTATIVQATDKIQFASALLVAFPAGIGFDTVFTRMQKQMGNQPISVNNPK